MKHIKVTVHPVLFFRPKAEDNSLMAAFLLDLLKVTVENCFVLFF
jgi:hypothetical protein